jgi:pimeloyl-ACP methyl ester carboxylesterase
LFERAIFGRGVDIRLRRSWRTIERRAARLRTLPPSWRLAACNALIERGDFKAAIPALELLGAHRKQGVAARKLLDIAQFSCRSDVLRQMEDASEILGCAQPGVVGPLVERVPGARRAIVVFYGVGSGFWVLAPVLRRYLKPLGCHLVFVRDSRKIGHLGGIEGLGADYQASVDALRKLIERLGATEIAMMGMSLGGYAALRYGLDLGADRALGLGAYTNVTPGEVETNGRDALTRIARSCPAMARDLLPLYAEAERRPRVALWYGADHNGDRRQAERFTVLEGVELRPVPDLDDHDVLRQMMSSGQVRSVVTWLADPPGVEAAA